MSYDFKKEAKKQYLRHFRGWFIVVGGLLALTAGLGIARLTKGETEEINTKAPIERVYDNADILTTEEEDKLRAYIAKKEAEFKVHFVVLTINQPLEGQEAREQYGYRSTDWTQNIMDIADDFWDENGYGYNKSFEGDGAILVDNRYESDGVSQKGEHLSTSGKVENSLSERAVESVLNAVDKYYDTDPYRAYIAYIDKVCAYLENGRMTSGNLMNSIFYWLGALIVSVISAATYASSHLKKNKVEKTVAVKEYVVGGKPLVRNNKDDFIRKNVVTRHIETSSGSGSGRSSGGGGHHTSSSGASHGGGSHRH